MGDMRGVAATSDDDKLIAPLDQRREYGQDVEVRLDRLEFRVGVAEIDMPKHLVVGQTNPVAVETVLGHVGCWMNGVSGKVLAEVRVPIEEDIIAVNQE